MSKKSLRYGIIIALLLLLVLAACTKEPTGQVIIEKTTSRTSIQTFLATNDELCTDAEGKPIIRFFATSWCPHCKWIKSTYIQVMKDYIAEGKITAYLWEVDTNDDLLQDDQQPVPESEKELFKKYNPQGSIPTFVFGCKYYRIGNGYEQINDLEAEKAEFHAVIKNLLGGEQNEKI